jgi:hypothetical protein
MMTELPSSGHDYGSGFVPVGKVPVTISLGTPENMGGTHFGSSSQRVKKPDFFNYAYKQNVYERANRLSEKSVNDFRRTRKKLDSLESEKAEKLDQMLRKSRLKSNKVQNLVKYSTESRKVFASDKQSMLDKAL